MRGSPRLIESRCGPSDRSVWGISYAKLPTSLLKPACFSLCMGQSVSTEPHRMTRLLSDNHFLSFLHEQSLKRFCLPFVAGFFCFSFIWLGKKKKHASKTINHVAWLEWKLHLCGHFPLIGTVLILLILLCYVEWIIQKDSQTQESVFKWVLSEIL